MFYDKPQRIMIMQTSITYYDLTSKPCATKGIYTYEHNLKTNLTFKRVIWTQSLTRIEVCVLQNTAPKVCGHSVI